MKNGFSREQELTAQACLANPDVLAQKIIQREWSAVATTVEYAQADVPAILASTDPALYQMLRSHITRFFLLGGACLNLNKIRALANQPSTELSSK